MEFQRCSLHLSIERFLKGASGEEVEVARLFAEHGCSVEEASDFAALTVQGVCHL